MIILNAHFVTYKIWYKVLEISNLYHRIPWFAKQVKHDVQ